VSTDEPAASTGRSAKLHPLKETLRTVGSVVLALGFAYAVFDLVIGFKWPHMQPAAGRADSPISNPLAHARFSQLTEFGKAAFDAAISPDGEFVTFVSNRDGPFDVFWTQIGVDGFFNRTKGRQEFALGDVRAPLRQVGFTGGRNEIWLRGGASGERVRVLPLLEGPARLFLETNVINLDWSPDDQRIAFHNNLEGDPLYVGGSDETGSEMILRADQGMHQHYPVWSIDGDWIYLVIGRPAALETDLWRVRPDGTEREQLTDDKLDVRYPAPIDKRTVLYSARDTDGAGPWLWAIDVETKVSSRASVGLEQYSSVAASADGRLLVATVQAPRARLWSVPILDRVATESDAAPLDDLTDVARRRAHALPPGRFRAGLHAGRAAFTGFLVTRYRNDGRATTDRPRHRCCHAHL
jgi:hypothetical protein